MKEVSFTYDFSCNDKEFKIINNKTEVECFDDFGKVNKYSRSQIISYFLTKLVDMDEWKFSWHNNIYKYRDKKIKNKIIENIESKIEQRERELELLKFGLKIIKRKV